MKYFKLHKLIFLILFFLVINSFILLGESYSEHRLDDKVYLSGGNKFLLNEGRIDSLNTKESETSNESTKSKPLSGISVKQYFATKFYSQKGGDKEDLASRYTNQVNYSPEISGKIQTTKSKWMILLSPLGSYREDYLLKRNINRMMDLELIFAGKWENHLYSINLEGGRGFQRLDAYGVIFNGFGNYSEMNFHWKPFNLKLSLIGLSYNYRQENFTIRANNTNDKLIGGNLLFQSMPFLQHLQIFNYQILEPRQVAEKSYLQEPKTFKPKGNLYYRGFELKTKNFLSNINSEWGVFSVTGYRDYAEYDYQKYNNINKTNALLSYFIINLLFEKMHFRLGGLYASKDRSSSLNRAHNGYSPLLSDIRIFGGKSSFLLMENVNQKQGRIFNDFDSTEENKYDKKGMELASFGVSYYFSENLQFIGILNHVSSRIGIGNEGILSIAYHLTSVNQESSWFLLASLCIARVNPVTPEKVIYDEFRIDPASKEFTRIYLSGGIYF